MDDKKKQMPYKVVTKGGMAQIEEKKSKFIATVYSVKNEEEAIRFIEEGKKKYQDARHNCFAYIIGNAIKTTRYSDDGEPSGTAGKPILEILLTEEITDTLIIITRYFGGTLLGTGGLVRAYSKAAKEGIKGSEIALMRYATVLSLVTDYNHIGKIQYIVNQNDILTRSTEYTQEVKVTLQIPIEQEIRVKKEIMEVTNGQVCFIELEKGFYADKQ